jgi:hypothetical protein
VAWRSWFRYRGRLEKAEPTSASLQGGDIHSVVSDLKRVTFTHFIKRMHKMLTAKM